MAKRRLHLMRISNDESYMDTHLIGKEQAKNRKQNEESCVKCHTSGMKETYL